MRELAERPEQPPVTAVVEAVNAPFGVEPPLPARHGALHWVESPILWLNLHLQTMDSALAAQIQSAQPTQAERAKINSRITAGGNGAR